ncbi:hypothetical protein FDA33_09230 [Clostridium botulinum]|nr:hypothetical protein [Clostridium botulinum]NFI18084.1 hypothetical protein [Clostridium botulinum]NFL93050.1 hypothetical protein [Clostridium botulinum]NFN51625.1 hypothetical protein [Clostridium botulinum]NFO27249.1 hypothetical protein [Clostridium botulinum]
MDELIKSITSVISGSTDKLVTPTDEIKKEHYGNVAAFNSKLNEYKVKKQQFINENKDIDAELDTLKAQLRGQKNSLDFTGINKTENKIKELTLTKEHNINNISLIENVLDEGTPELKELSLRVLDSFEKYNPNLNSVYSENKKVIEKLEVQLNGFIASIKDMYMINISKENNRIINEKVKIRNYSYYEGEE